MAAGPISSRRRSHERRSRRIPIATRIPWAIDEHRRCECASKNDGRGQRVVWGRGERRRNQSGTTSSAHGVPSQHTEDLLMKSTGGIVMACAVIALLAAGETMAQSLPPGMTAEAVQTASTPAQHRAIADAYAKEAE